MAVAGAPPLKTGLVIEAGHHQSDTLAHLKMAR